MEKCLQNVSQKLKSEPHLYHLVARSINNIRITERSQVKKKNNNLSSQI